MSDFYFIREDEMNHIQLDFFEPISEKEIQLYEVKKLKDDIARMRRSFFVRLDAHERKYEKILNQLEKRM